MRVIGVHVRYSSYRSSSGCLRRALKGKIVERAQSDGVQVRAFRDFHNFALVFVVPRTPVSCEACSAGRFS